jgi:hypothetical protein
MRLRELDGRFFGKVNAARRSSMLQGDRIRGAQGVLFQCPKCSAGKPVGDDGRGFRGAHYIKVCFSNPRNALPAPAEYDDNPRWEMSGSSLDDLTLSPSINLDVPSDDGVVYGCRWHGWVRSGDAA